MGTRETSNWMAQVDIFVDPDGSETSQAASCAAIGKLLLERKISIQDVVTAIGKYLTAADNSIRARGLILLGELLVKLAATPLENTVIHSLTSFFTARLADWHCLRGALIGSLALLRRSPKVGRVEKSDAEDMARAVLKDLHVQALGLTDRLLSLELFECLVNLHGPSVSSLGGDLVYAAIAAIEEEKDPRCLLVAFHLVELLVRLFPSPDGSLGDCAGDVFDVVGRYFPVSFTPPPNDSRGISRDDLADALLKVFSSTPLFAPYCIPLLLEKLSSSLQRAKLDSLRYLGPCALAFGPQPMSEHVDAMWPLLKAELIPTGDGQKDAQVREAALKCLTQCVEASQKGVEESETAVAGDLMKLVSNDACVEDLFRSVESDLKKESVDEASSKRASEQTRAAGQMLAAVVKGSPSSCRFVTEKILGRLVLAGGMDPLGRTETPPADDVVLTEYHELLEKEAVSVLGLEVAIQILGGAAKVAERIALMSVSSMRPGTKRWLEPVSSVAPKLLVAFSLITSRYFPRAYQSKLGVAGLQALASFPVGYSPLTEEELQRMFTVLVETLLEETNASDLRNSALDTIITASNLEERFRSPHEIKDSTVLGAVSPRLLEAVQQAATTGALKFPLQALAAVAGARQIARQAVLSGLGQIITTKFKQLGTTDDASERMVPILECLSQEIIPFCEKGSADQTTACDTVLDLWSACQELSRTSNDIPDEVLSAIMAVNRVTIRGCAEEAQEQILTKATSVLLDWDISDKPVEAITGPDVAQDLTLYTTAQSLGEGGFMPTRNTLMNTSMLQDTSQDWTVYTSSKFAADRGWLVALVASDVLGLLPTAVLPTRHLLLKIFLNTSISEVSGLKAGAAAQATASLINKWVDSLSGKKRGGGNIETVDQAIGEAVNGILMPVISQHLGDVSDHQERDQEKVVRAVHALAWIGKGLAMRGHVRVADVAAALFAVLQAEGGRKAGTGEGGAEKDGSSDGDSAVAQAAAESVGIIVKDNATCLDSFHNAVVRPLFKQRFFTSMLPPLQEAIRRAGTSSYRIWFFRALGHLLSGTPSSAVLTDGQKVFPLVLEGLSVLCKHPEDSDLLLSTLLTLSSFLTDDNYGRAITADYVSAMVKRLTNLVHYQASLVVRETALQCLGAIIGLPFTRVFPEKPQVLKAVSAALDDHKRRVRKEAVRCRRLWSAISS